jgi:HPt (histidine-containing phosphotransfer) domain-containing protein
MQALLLDRRLVAELRRLGYAAGRADLFSAFVAKLEGSLAAFRAAFSNHIARGDITAAERAAHTLKGTCRQLGAQALGDLFAEIESSAKAGDYVAAARKFEGAADLIAQSLQALKNA